MAKKITINKIMYVALLLLPIMLTIGHVLIAGLNENSGVTLTSGYVLEQLTYNYNNIGLAKMNPTYTIIGQMFTTLQITDTLMQLMLSYLINISLIYAIINIPLTIFKYLICKMDKFTEKAEK